MRELERTRRRKGRRRGWRSFAPRGVMRKFEISRPSPASCHQPKKYNTAASHKRLIQTPCHLSTTPSVATREIIKTAGVRYSSLSCHHITPRPLVFNRATAILHTRSQSFAYDHRSICFPVSIDRNS